MSLVVLEPWSEADLKLLRQINTPPMRKHTGGPETDEQLLVRHRRYLAFPVAGTGCMFSIRLPTSGRPIGSVGYAERGWRGEQVYEMGWNVLPDFQGQGYATAAVAAAVRHAAASGRLRWLHAYPSVDNPASNALCRRIGFGLVGECDFELPRGQHLRSNEWRLDLPRLTATDRPAKRDQ